jgi:hypothetical protein
MGVVERGGYFRLVANIIVDSVKELMLEKQLVKSYDGKTKG